MKIKTYIAVALALIFALAFAAPVFAQDMTHSVDYDLEGTISLKKHAGHFCNTGAEMKQLITGAGTMTKSTDVYMMAGYLTVDDDNDWIAASTESLTVTTSIKLCAPPKYIFGVPETTIAAVAINNSLLLPKGMVVPLDYLYSLIEYGDLDEAIKDGFIEPLTKQIWAAQVKADPGFSGNMHTDFTAAYGPFAGFAEEPINTDFIVQFNGPLFNEVADHQWGFDFDDDGKLITVLGEDYVGNYFTMDAWFRTSMGTTKRFVSLSSPFSHAYLTEDITVVGKAEVKEALELMNLPEGQEATTDWWDLF